MTASRDNPKKVAVLFVCTGNICRSPMAEGLLRHLIPAGRQVEFEIQSAGTGAWHGAAASEHAIAVCRDDQIDISGHRSQPVTRELMSGASLILALARNHYDLMREAFPQLGDRIHLLKRFDADGRQPEHESVADPIGESRTYYESIYREIRAEIERILPRVLALAEDGA